MKDKLKIFVWTGFSPDYTSGLAFAIAEDETDARKQIVKAYGYSPYEWGTLHVLSTGKRKAFAVGGGA